MPIDLIPIFKSLLILFFSIGDGRSSVVDIPNFSFLTACCCYLYYYYLLTTTSRSMVWSSRRGFLFARAHRAWGGVLVGGGGTWAVLGSLFELSDVHVIGHVTARGPRVFTFSGHRAPLHSSS